MSTDTLEHALQELPGGHALPTAGHIKRLASLIDGEQPLQPFLEQLVPQLAEIFSAVAGVAWLKAHAAGDAIFGVPYQMDRVIQSPLDQKKHEKLVQLAWQQRQPMLAEPQVTHSRKASAATNTAASASADKPSGNKSTSPTNPTSHALLFGPVMHFGEPVALIELVLPSLESPLPPEQKKLFLRSIQLIGERVHGGLKQRMSLPAATITQAVDQLRALTEEIGGFQQQIRRTIEARLQQFHGWTFGSLEENQRFAKMVHQLLDNHGLRVECPECGHASILRCLRAGNAKHGVFVFDHYLDSGRTFHGGPTTVPFLRVANKPLRRT